MWDLKSTWCTDEVFDKFQIELGVEKILKDRFENAEYKVIKDEVFKIYDEGK